MGTTTQNDNRAKFLELRKQGISVADARNQTYGPPPIVPDATPTTPVEPTPPVTPPAPTVTGVDGQQFVQAPVDPTTGLSKPIEATAPIQAEVKPPEPIKTEIASSTKTEPVIDYNVSAGREQQIQDNVAKITQTNPNLLKDRNAYNQAFGYETADAGKKALLDSTFSGQVKPSQDDIFNSMRSGVSVGDPKSTEFRQAQARINTFKKYSVYDTASLATSLQSGDLLVGTKAYNDLVSDPTMALKIQKAQAFNKGVVDIVKTGETQWANTMAQNPTVANALADGNLSKAEYDQLTNNDEVSAQGKLVETNKTKYETIKAQYDAVEDDVDKEFTGKEVTDSFKAKITADRRKGMYKDYQIASLEYQNSLGTYTNLKADSTALLAQNMELYKTEQANKAEIAKEQRVIQAQKDALQYEADFNKKQAELALQDPATAIKSVMDEYKKLGIPFTSTVQSRLAEFKASGKPLEQFLTEMGQNIQASPAYKQYQAQQAGKGISYETIGDKVYKNTNGVLTETGISAKSAPTPVWQEWEDATGKHAGWVTPGVTPSTSTATAVKPTGNIVPVTAGNKTVRLDQVGATGFESAISQLTTAGIPIVVGQGARDQSATIKEMADRYGIAFNASNPAETAQKLRSAGHQVADPGKSNHESGMAIDVYGDSKLGKVSTAQEKILNANGWYSANIPGDAGHFEYRGAKSQGTEIDNTSAYQKRLNTGALPTGMKEGTAQANEWLQGYSQWKSTSNPLSDSVQKRVDSYSDDYSKNANVVSAFKFAPLLRQYDTVKVSDLSSSQRQGIISDYAKALDPDSVVREGEYATVAKYSSSFGEKTLSEINQFLSGNGTLSDAAAQKVIDAIKSRGKNYVEQEKNVRNQYIEKINRATGYKDGDMQLVYPDYSKQSTNPQKSDFLNSLKSIATEFTKGLTSIK